MLFFVFLSLVVMLNLPLGSGVSSGAPRLCGTHRCSSVFVDFNHATSGVRAAREAFETFRASRDDRVGVSAGLDCVTLFDLLVKERVECVPARAQRIDVTHEREYRKSERESWDLSREVEAGRLRFAGRLTELAERVPAARCALPLPVPEWQRRCFIYGNRNREVVQRR